MGKLTHDQKRIAIRERNRGILASRLACKSVNEIATEFGISQQRVSQILARELSRCPPEEVDAVRKLELQRLDAWQSKLEPSIQAGELDAVGVGLRIQERRAKYLGLDAATKVENTGNTTVRVEMLVPRAMPVDELRAWCIRCLALSAPDEAPQFERVLTALEGASG